MLQPHQDFIKVSAKLHKIVGYSDLYVMLIVNNLIYHNALKGCTRNGSERRLELNEVIKNSEVPDLCTECDWSDLFVGFSQWNTERVSSIISDHDHVQAWLKKDSSTYAQAGKMLARSDVLGRLSTTTKNLKDKAYAHIGQLLETGFWDHVKLGMVNEMMREVTRMAKSLERGGMTGASAHLSATRAAMRSDMGLGGTTLVASPYWPPDPLTGEIFRDSSLGDEYLVYAFPSWYARTLRITMFSPSDDQPSADFLAVDDTTPELLNETVALYDVEGEFNTLEKAYAGAKAL